MAVIVTKFEPLSSYTITPKTGATGNYAKALAISAQKPVSSSPSRPTSEDYVTLSATRSTSNAIRSLSDAESFVTVGKNALNNIKSLLEDLDTITQRLESEVDPNYRSELSQEGTTILDELNRISNETTYNYKQVLDAGITNFSIDMDGSDPHSTSNLSVSVANLPASAENLGLNEITANSLETDTTNSRSSINSALSIVRNSLTTLTDTENKISQITSGYGTRIGMESQFKTIDSANKYSESKTTSNSTESIILATKELTKDQLTNLHKLSETRVRDLLLTQEEESTNSQTPYNQLPQSNNSIDNTIDNTVSKN